jgi:demethylmenaquinone methyltransferase/2-methoxy-6-polyprenyl-1,4-benzoquinol methylase/phosphoethanolamine N-methyltransferase
MTLAAARQVGATGRVVGVDAAPEMITVAQRKAVRTKLPLTFQVDVIERLPFPDGSFDVVLSSLMFHHLPDDLKRQGLAEIRRILKPGGRLLIVDFKRGTNAHAHLSLAMLLHGNMRRGLHDYVPLVRDAGFTALETGDMNFSGVGFLRAQVR